MRVFVGETLSCAVLDSGCSQTVCGKAWLDCYTDSLINENVIKAKPSTSAFKFGNGPPLMSEKKVVIPVVIGSKQVNLETDVIDADIPLLLSKGAMKKAYTVLNFNEDTVSMFREEHKLVKTSSGHYAIPLTTSRKIANSEDTYDVSKSYCFLTTNRNSRKEKGSMVRKLHQQLCHCCSNKLKQLIKTSKLWKYDDEIVQLVDEISSTCDIYKKYKKAPLRHVVGLPLATKFTHTVAMDLITIHQGVWILHLVDIFSRLILILVTLKDFWPIMVASLPTRSIERYVQPLTLK